MTHTMYRALDIVPIPENILELGIEVGDLGVVDFVYDDGRGLHVEIGREDGTSAGFVQLEVGPAADGEDAWRVVGALLTRSVAKSPPTPPQHASG